MKRASSELQEMRIATSDSAATLRNLNFWIQSQNLNNKRLNHHLKVQNKLLSFIFSAAFLIFIFTFFSFIYFIGYCVILYHVFAKSHKYTLYWICISIYIMAMFLCDIVEENFKTEMTVSTNIYRNAQKTFFLILRALV